MASFFLGQASMSLTSPIAAEISSLPKPIGGRVTISRLQLQKPCLEKNKKPVVQFQSPGGYFGQRVLLSQKLGNGTTNHAAVSTSGSEDHEIPQDLVGEDYKTKEISLQESLINAFSVFSKFVRIYVIIAKASKIIAVCFLTAESLSDFTPMFFLKTLQTVVAGICIVIYTAGINQLVDIEIDKINKPYLPLASGELSVPNCIAILTITTLLSFLISWSSGSWALLAATFSSFVLANAYSLNVPFLRWKKNSLTAALYAVCDQALVVPVLTIIHAQTHIHGRSAQLTTPVIFATTMMTLFSVAMILFKDIPDIEGDQKHGMKTLASRLGPKTMFWMCIGLLEMGFGGAMFLGLSLPMAWSRYATVLAHGILALVTWIHAKSVNLKDKSNMQSFYMFIWRLFYVECMVMPFVR